MMHQLEAEAARADRPSGALLRAVAHKPHGDLAAVRLRRAALRAHLAHRDLPALELVPVEVPDSTLRKFQRRELYLPGPLRPARLAVCEDGRIGDAADVLLAEGPEPRAIHLRGQGPEEELAPIVRPRLAGCRWAVGGTTRRPGLHGLHLQLSTIQLGPVEILDRTRNQVGRSEFDFASTPRAASLPVREDVGMDDLERPGKV